MKSEIATRCSLLFTVVAAVALMLSHPARGAEPFLLSPNGLYLSADVDSSPRGEMLGAMAKRGFIAVKGSLPNDERLTLHFTDLTLEEALAKIMRGYNYALVERGKGLPPLLTVFGVVSRSAVEAPKNPGTSTAAATPGAPAVPALTTEQIAESRSYVPPMPQEIPVGKDGHPVPHWTDDEGKIHAVTDPTPPERTASGGQPQLLETNEQGSAAQPSGQSNSQGSEGNKQESSKGPGGRQEQPPSGTEGFHF